MNLSEGDVVFHLLVFASVFLPPGYPSQTVKYQYSSNCLRFIFASLKQVLKHYCA